MINWAKVTSVPGCSPALKESLAGHSKLWCEPASKQMSRKHNRWDRRWLISSAQIEWQNTEPMIKSRGEAGWRGEMESLCFSSCTLSSVHDGKYFYFTHQSITSCHLHRCHRCAIKHKSPKSSAKSLEWMCVAERCHLSQVLWQGELGKKCK